MKVNCKLSCRICTPVAVAGESHLSEKIIPLVSEKWKKKKTSEAWVGSRDKRPDPNFPRFRSVANITLFAISLRFTKLIPGVGYSCNF